MSIDAGLAGLLPLRRVDVGSSWTVEGDRFFATLMLGGEYGIHPSGAPVVPGDGISGTDLVAATYLHLGQVWDRVEGEVELTWSERIEVDGHEVALIEVAADLELERSLSDLLTRVLGDSGADTERREDYTVDVAWEVGLEGELAWDLDSERFRSLELEAAGECTLILGWEDAYGSIGIEADLTTESVLRLSASDEEE
ncbi:MAG: hypothetical protein AAFZ65_13325 [Planctomycetota bacterium]